MKYLRQFLIIISISCIGELMKNFIPLPIPASIYGLLILLFLLLSNILKLDDIKEFAYFLIQIMPILFIPASVGLMVVWPKLQKVFIPLFVITIVSTVVVMIVAAKATELILSLEERRKNNGKFS